MSELRDSTTWDGGCTCRAVRYRMASKPMFVHCCHCRWCQRESGASFALNALIEGSRVELLQGQPEVVNTPSNSGKGQKVTRCPVCRIALWSNYGGMGDVDPLRARRHARRAGPLSARHPHLHFIEATLGGAAARCARRPGVLQQQERVAGGEFGAPRGCLGLKLKRVRLKPDLREKHRCCSYVRIANVATRICRRSRARRSSAPSSARSASRV